MTTILSTAPKAVADKAGPRPGAEVNKYQIADQDRGVVAECIRVTTPSGGTPGHCHSVR